MWSDRESELDLLNVQHLVAAVQATVTEEHLLPVTVGVFGDWGSGKSTVMRLAQEEIDKDDGILCVHFNGWLFEGYEDAKAAILGTILDKLDEEKKASEKAEDLFKKLVKRVNWLRLVGWGGSLALASQGLPAEALIVAGGAKALPDAAKELIKAAPDGENNIRRSLRDFEKDFRELLDRSEVRAVVVFIDDLDRCLPTTIMHTLEAIRLFVFVPGMAFVIAADERLVRRAVRQHFPDVVETRPEEAANYPSRDVGREYLEKLIQVPIHVPPLSRAEIATYINLLFAQRQLDDGDFASCCEKVRTKLAKSVGTDVVFSLSTAEQFLDAPPVRELAEDLALAGQIGDVLAASVHGNPRQTKRFLNALILRLRMAKARGVDLERRATAKLMLLEYFKPTLFQALAVWQTRQGGVPAEIRRLETWIRGQAAQPPRTEPAEDADGTDADESENGDEKPDESALDDELQPWVAEEWMRSWLRLEPALAGVDLAPYFFFARERTGVIRDLAAQLSPSATRVLQQLLVRSSASHQAATRAASDLSPVESSGVFEALVRHTSTAEGMQLEDSPLAGLLRFVEARPEFQGQLLSYIRTIPTGSIGGWAPLLVLSAIEDSTHRTSLPELFGRWKEAGGVLRGAVTIAERRLGEK